MMRKELVGIAWFKKENFMAKLVALVPQHESFGNSVSGFTLIVLPYADDIR